MEDNRRRDLSSLADLTVLENFGTSESDSNSTSSSIVANCKGKLQQIEDSAKDRLTSWTNEKHDLYLGHLESSFVEQLHRSLGILACCSKDQHSKAPYVSQNLHPKTRENGFLEKIDRKRIQPLYSRAADSLILLKSRPRCARKQSFLRAAKLQHTSAVKNLCTEEKKRFDFSGEFSDQNFVDEVNEQMCITTMSKRSKTIVSEV